MYSIISMDKQKKPLKFVHITKNGGTSIEDVGHENGLAWGRFDGELKKIFNTTQFGQNPKKYLRRKRAVWHYPLQYMDINNFKNYTNKYNLFMVVRNPYTRCISEFYCRWGGPKCWVYRNRYKRSPNSYTVEEFNKFIQDRLADVLYNRSYTPHWIPQHLYITNRYGKKHVKHVLKFENLENEFNSLMKQYNLDIKLNKHKNSNEKKYSVNDLTNKTKYLIQKVYRLDFTYFGYKM